MMQTETNDHGDASWARHGQETRPKKHYGTMVGGWQLVVGGVWQLMAVVGGWWFGWWWLAAGTWRLVALAVVGGWRLVVDSGWRLAVGSGGRWAVCSP